MRVLIANRGEVACRVVRACRDLGLTSIAVFAEPDREADHVAQADEAVPLEGVPPHQAYLSGEAVLAAAAATGADAIHPGYGFLSENAGFAAEVQARGLRWIGPEPEVIAMLGAKDRARDHAVAAGVPVATGGVVAADGAIDIPGLTAPVMVKAAAGGGGRGMRAVESLEELAEAIPAVRREAEILFGDGTLLVERMVRGARHIEVQVLGDSHGNQVHLFDRDCSLQRRRQKVVEEAPAPLLQDHTRRLLGEAAVRLCASLGYTTAGTVEFLVDPGGEFFFLEMNTRLQVEHGVTELVTGVDIVVEQIRTALGEPLGIDQDSVRLDGAAIEVRLNAEDPSRNFLGSPGRLERVRFPAGDGVRIDTGVSTGSQVPPYYDSLLAKVLTRGRDRAEALGRMRGALDEVVVEGVMTNRQLLRRIVGAPWFAGADYDTATLDARLAELIEG